MHNGEKILNLMEKMYIEFLGKFDEVNAKLDQKADKADIIRLENDHGAKLSALFDGYVQNSEKLEEVITRLDIIESKVDRHDIQIAVLDKRKKGVK